MDHQTSNMNIDEVSKWLNIRPSTVYGFCRRGEIPCTKIGRQWRFERNYIERWLVQKALDVCLPREINK